MHAKIGVIKEVDKLGRIVIPKDFRDRLGFARTVEVVLTEQGVLIRNPEYELVKKEESTNAVTF